LINCTKLEYFNKYGESDTNPGLFVECPARLGREVAPREPVRTLSERWPLKKWKRRRPGFGQCRSPMLPHFYFKGSYRRALGQCSLDRSIATKKCLKSTRFSSNPFLAKKRGALLGSRTDPKPDTFLRSCQIGTWNANSISNTKFEYSIRNLTGNTNSSDGFLGITELSNTNTKLVNFVNSHPDYPIISDPKNYRVGLMTSKFLSQYVKILDVWQYVMKKRKVKSNTVIYRLLKTKEKTFFRQNCY